MQKTLSKTKGLAILLTLMLTLPLTSIAFITPVRAASGTITLNPIAFTTTGTDVETTIAVANGGVFGSGATVEFWISEDTTFTSTDTPIGTVTLPAGQTSFINTVVELFGATEALASGTYYIAATDDGSTWTSYVEVTLTLRNPELNVIPPSVTPFPNTAVDFEGTDFEAGSTVRIYLSYPGGQLLTTVTASPAGTIEGSFIVPTLPEDTYDIIAQEVATTLSDSDTLDIVPGVLLSKYALGKPAGQAFNVYGYGFAAGATITANSITIAALTAGVTLPSTSYTTGSSGTVHPEATASASGTFTISGVSTTSDFTGTGFATVTVVSGVTATIVVSEPGLTLGAVATVGTEPIAVNVGDELTVWVLDYPASTGLTIKLGDLNVGSITTDAFGAGKLDITVPPTPGTATGLVYVVDAVNDGLGYVAFENFEVSVASSIEVEVKDPIYPNYVENGGTIKVSGSGFGALDVISFSTTPTLMLGPDTIVADASGSFSVEIMVSAAFTTDTSVDFKATGEVAGEVSPTGVEDFYQLGPATLTLDPDHASPATSITVTGNGYITGASYEIYFNNAPLPTPVEFTGAGATTISESFIVPAVGNDVYPVSIILKGTGYVHSIEYFAVSTPGAVPTIKAEKSGVAPSSTGFSAEVGDTMDIFLFGFPSTGAVTVTLVGSGDVAIAGAIGSDGAYVFRTISVPSLPRGTYAMYATVGTTTSQNTIKLTIALKFTTFDPTSGPVGTSLTIAANGLPRNTAFNLLFGGEDLGYIGSSDSSGTLPSVTLTNIVPTVLPGDYIVGLAPSASPTTANILVSETFTVENAFTLTPNPEAIAGQSVQFSWDIPPIGAGPTLVSPIWVTVLIDGEPYTTLQASYDGTYLTGSFVMPNGAADATLEIKVYYSDSTMTAQAGVATAPIEATESLTITDATTDTVGGTITISDALGTITEITVPTTAIDATPKTISVTGTNGFTGSVVVTAYDPVDPGANDTSGSISYYVEGALGSMTIRAPALATGSHTDTFTINTAGGTATLTSTFNGEANNPEIDFVPSPQTGTSDIATIKRISGAGSLLIGVDLASDIAYIKGTVSNIAVSLSELDAKVVAISGDVATIDTKLGTMSAKLDAIDAAITSLDGKVVTISTSLGEVKTSVDAVSAAITSLDGTVATISTTVGDIETSVDDIGLKVTSIEGDVATIETALGTIDGKVTSIDGTVATIETDVGTIEADVSDILEQFPITVPPVDMTPVWIAVVLSLIAAIAACYAVITIHRKIAG